MNYSKELETAIYLAKESGTIIKQAFYNTNNHNVDDDDGKNNSNPTNKESISSNQVYQKDDLGTDLVTVTDRKIENFVFDHLRKTFPNDLLIGEESSYELSLLSTDTIHTPDHSDKKKNDIYEEFANIRSRFLISRSWVVDPIDGTANFVHGFPFVCISIGFCVNGQVMLGVVYNPITNELYHAVKGNGAFMNNIPLPLFQTQHPVSSSTTHHDHSSSGSVVPNTVTGHQDKKKLKLKLVGAEFGHERTTKTLDSKFASMRNVVESPCIGLRCLGSAALGLCYVARGTLDLWWEAGVHIWDVAGAAIILSESGCILTNFDHPETLKKETESGGQVYCDYFCRKFLGFRKLESEPKTLELANIYRSYICPINIEPDFFIPI